MVFRGNRFDWRKIQIWKSQVLIPHFDSKHAYLGPIEKTESEEIQEIFPYYKKRSPLIFIQNPDTPYDLKFLDTKVFKAAAQDLFKWQNIIEP